MASDGYRAGHGNTAGTQGGYRRGPQAERGFMTDRPVGTTSQCPRCYCGSRQPCWSVARHGPACPKPQKAEAGPCFIPRKNWLRRYAVGLGRGNRTRHLWPNSLPVFRLSKCILVQLGHMMPSYSLSGISGSSSNWCWTLKPVVGHLKTKLAICQDMTAVRTRP